MSVEKKRIVEAFGIALDHDDFEYIQTIMAPACIYDNGDEVLTGPVEIAADYKKNMERGKAMLDRLEWGESYVEHHAGDDYFVYFEDRLQHGGESHTYKCRQKIRVNDDMKLIRIEHQELPGEREAVEAFKRRVGVL